jgi:hypothetical protein
VRGGDDRAAGGVCGAHADGGVASGTGSGPVWVRQGAGDGTSDEYWAPVDLTLAAAEDGAVRPVAHPPATSCSQARATPIRGRGVTIRTHLL